MPANRQEIVSAPARFSSSPFQNERTPCKVSGPCSYLLVSTPKSAVRPRYYLPPVTLAIPNETLR
jgi:hypothetical protein